MGDPAVLQLTLSQSSPPQSPPASSHQPPTCAGGALRGFCASRSFRHLKHTHRSSAARPKASVREAPGSGQREPQAGQQGAAAPQKRRARSAAQPCGPTARSSLGIARSFEVGALGAQEGGGGVSRRAARQERGRPARPQPRRFPELSPATSLQHWALKPRVYPGSRRVRPDAASLSLSLSPSPGPPGLVVLNISQLRHRTVELLRTTGPSARVRDTVGLPSCGERSPDALGTARGPRGTRPCARIPAGRAPPALLQPPGPDAAPDASDAAARRNRGSRPPSPAPPRPRRPRGPLVPRAPRGAFLCRASALPGAGMRPRRAGPTGFSGRGGFGPAGPATDPPRPGTCSARPRGGGPDSAAAPPRPAPSPPASGLGALGSRGRGARGAAPAPSGLGLGLSGARRARDSTLATSGPRAARAGENQARQEPRAGPAPLGVGAAGHTHRGPSHFKGNFVGGGRGGGKRK
ncbi:uncharacterized protein LOC128928885 [Callithrix jacchus]